MALLRKRREAMAAASTQIRSQETMPFGLLDAAAGLGGAEGRLYRAIREAVPVVDAAIGKIVRLCGGVTAQCTDPEGQRQLQKFLREVPTGRRQKGLQAFLDSYLDSMLTYGQGVGEMVLSGDGREIEALLCARVEHVCIREGETPLDFTICGYDSLGQPRPLPRQDLLLFTPYCPEAHSPYGVSLLRSMPFLTELLGKIYRAMGANWDRMGNVRFAVVYKPQGGELDAGTAQAHSRQIAEEWSRAMQSTKSGHVRDFVAVGDVEIKVIGADNQVLDSEVPVRQILEQLVAKSGIPPFMLGLSWSSTERMSTQQADMLTSELEALRRTLTPAVEQICRTWLRLHGFYCGCEAVWEPINLQDELEEAKAAWYREQARQLRLKNDAEESQR